MTLDSNSQAIAFGIVLLVIVVGSMIYTKGEAEPVTLCVSNEDRVSIRTQVLLAVDEAFKENAKRLFTGWLKDPHQQPERAAAGLQNSIVAYQRARLDVFKWNPVAC